MTNLFIGYCLGLLIGSVLSIPIIIWKEQIFDAIEVVIGYWRDAIEVGESIDRVNWVQFVPTAESELAGQFSRLGEAFRNLGATAQQAAQAFAGWVSAVDPLWVILPGEWPDNFILLNRYLRTGVRPPFLFND